MGLVTPAIISYRRDGEPGVLRYLERACPDYLIIFPAWFPTLSAMTDRFRPIYRVTLDHNTVAGADEMVVYETRVDVGPLSHDRPRAGEARIMPVMKRLVVVAAVIATSRSSGTAPAGRRRRRAQMYRWIDGRAASTTPRGSTACRRAFGEGAVIIGVRATRRAAGARRGRRRRSGIGRVRFTPGQPIMVSVRINGATPATLMLDTGASRTVINPSGAGRRWASSYRDAQRGSIRGVTGEAAGACSCGSRASR